MLARSMARTVSIVGAGRIGKTLGKRLRALGWRIGAVVTRTPATAREAARAIGAGSPHVMSTVPGLRRESASRNAKRLAASTANLAADVIFITTPDESLPSVVKTLAQFGNHRGKRYWRGKIVLHTSGTLDRSVLAPLARLGAATGSLHPMQTFSGRGIPKLAGVTFAIEGDARALRTARGIARALGGIPVRIASADKPVCPRRSCRGRGQHLSAAGSFDRDAGAHRLHPPPRFANAAAFVTPNAR